MKKRILSIFLSVVMAVTLMPANSFATGTEQTDEVPAEEPSLSETLLLEEELSEENAIPEESTETSTVFDLGDGKKTVVYYSQDVRFEEDGELTDYDPALVRVTEEESEGGEELSDYAYENKEGDSSHYLPKKLTQDSQILMEKDGYAIRMLPMDEKIQEAEIQVEKEETLTPYETVEEKNTVAVYEADGENRSYEYTSLNKGIKESIVLKKKPAKK